jgi:hypothetical protein
MATHIDDRQHTCTLCMQTFTNKRNLTAHMFRVHVGKGYTCITCMPSFTRKDNCGCTSLQYTQLYHKCGMCTVHDDDTRRKCVTYYLPPSHILLHTCLVYVMVRNDINEVLAWNSVHKCVLNMHMDEQQHASIK